MARRSRNAISTTFECECSVYRHGPQGRQSKHPSAGLVHSCIGSSSVHSNGAHYLEGKTYPSRQPDDRLDRQDAGTGIHQQAEITKDPTVSHQIVEDFPKRYLMARLGLHTPTQAMFDQGKILAIVITAVRDLPAGFKSQPGRPAPGLERKP